MSHSLYDRPSVVYNVYMTGLLTYYLVILHLPNTLGSVIRSDLLLVDTPWSLFLDDFLRVPGGTEDSM